MKSYGHYPEESIEWWDQAETPIYGDEVEDFEWVEVDEDDDSHED